MQQGARRAGLTGLAVLAAAVCAAESGSARQAVLPPPQVEAGSFPASWHVPQSQCGTAPPFRVHQYNPGLLILRQSGCTHYEKPFLYLLLGTREALLVDTGAPGASLVPTIDAVLGDSNRSLLVVHSHGHGDHTANDGALRLRPATNVVAATASAVAQFFGIPNWPSGTAQYDLGGRVVDIVPIPGHEAAHIAIYDRRTGILLTGDTLYPGRLYVSDQPAWRASIDRLAAFTEPVPVAHVLGAHIENTRWPFLDYPVGTQFQPDEHVLELGRAHLLELQAAMGGMSGPLTRHWLRDFTLWPF